MYHNKKEFLEAETTDIVGSSENPNTCLHRVKDSGILYRRIYIDSLKGGEDIDIAHFADMHLNHINIKDFEEKHLSILSTLEYRRAFRRNATFVNAETLMKIAALFDKAVVTGDVIDYLTWGALEFVEKFIYKNCPEALLTVGGHDITRVMQGIVPDPTSLASRYEVLKAVWKNDLYYHSEILGDKVLIVALNNGESKYFDFQIEKLKADIQKARKEDLILLLFEHEPLCTRNEREKAVIRLWVGDDRDSNNFYEDMLGNADADEVTTEMYRLITENADIIKGIFCGHTHNEYYTEIKASYTRDGKKIDAVIPQYVVCGVPYDEGHMLVITVR